MHLLERIEKADLAKRAAMKPPFGPCFPDDKIERATVMKIFGSSIKGPGGDFCLFQLLDEAGNVLAEHRISGY
jgi:hypothetical protein